MHKMRLREDGFAAQAFTHEDDRMRQIAVVFPGLPYIPGLQASGRFLFSLGYDVVQPQYTGTYDSDGEFSPQSAIGTVDRLRLLLSRSFVTNHRNGKKVAIESGIEFAAAHSFGTWVLANAFIIPSAGHDEADLMVEPVLEEVRRNIGRNIVRSSL